MSNLVQIRSVMAKLLMFKRFQNGGRRHLGFFADVNFDGKSGSRTPSAACVSNLAQIYAIVTELWT